MIVDLILDRKDGAKYNAHDFYVDVMGYGEIGEDITRAMDFGTESDVRRELCEYITANEYNPAICDYINSREWLKNCKEEVQSNAEVQECLA